jgi:hypothetical protein
MQSAVYILAHTVEHLNRAKINGKPIILGFGKVFKPVGFKYSGWWNVSPSETTSAFFQVQFRQLCKGFMQVWMNSNTGVKDKRQVEQMPYLWSLSHVWLLFGMLIPMPFMQHLSYESPKIPPYFNLLLIKNKILNKIMPGSFL